MSKTYQKNGDLIVSADGSEVWGVSGLVCEGLQRKFVEKMNGLASTLPLTITTETVDCCCGVDKQPYKFIIGKHFHTANIVFTVERGTKTLKVWSGWCVNDVSTGKFWEGEALVLEVDDTSEYGGDVDEVWHLYTYDCLFDVLMKTDPRAVVAFVNAE